MRIAVTVHGRWILASLPERRSFLDRRGLCLTVGDGTWEQETQKIPCMGDGNGATFARVPRPASRVPRKSQYRTIPMKMFKHRFPILLLLAGMGLASTAQASLIARLGGAGRVRH